MSSAHRLDLRSGYELMGPLACGGDRESALVLPCTALFVFFNYFPLMLYFLDTIPLFPPPELMPFELINPDPTVAALTSSIDVIALRRSPVLD